MKRQAINIAALLVSIALLVVFIWPYVAAVSSGLILAYIFYPVYRAIKRRLKSKSLGAFTLILFIIMLIIVPSYIVVNSLVGEVNGLYQVARARTQSQNITHSALLNVLDSANLSSYYTLLVDNAEEYAYRGARRLESYLTTQVAMIISAFSRFLLQLFITLFVFYYALVDGDRLSHKLRSLLAIFIQKPDEQDRIYRRFFELMYAVVYGTILTALIQGLAAGLGYWIFGISSPVVLTLATTLAALLPYVGAALIWFPVALILILKGLWAGNTMLIIDGIGLMMYGTLIISIIDNIARPQLIGYRGKVHPVVILFGVISGIALFGFIGIFVGPLLISFLIVLTELLWSELNGTES